MISPRSWALVAALLLAQVLPACVIGDIGLEGRPCPCISGYICDTRRNVCVRADDTGALASDAGAIDTGRARTTCESMTDAIFCEDFESGELGRWTISTPEGGTIAPSTLAARDGVQGLQITMPVSASAVRLSTAIDPGPAMELYFSAWVYVASAPAGPIGLFDLEVAGVGAISAELIPDTRAFQVRVADAGSIGVSSLGRDNRWGIGNWRCMQAHVIRGDVGGLVEVIDAPPGTALLQGVDTDWGVPYDVFSIAIQPSAADAEVRFDDMMWTTRPVPCP